MLADLIERKVKVILDTNPDLMKRMLAYKPFMIKTTSTELGELLGRKIETIEETVAAAKEVREMGAEHVMILYDSQ